jgi:hypothetical protein
VIVQLQAVPQQIYVYTTVRFQESTSCEQCSVKEELPAQNLQLCFNCDIRRLAFMCYQMRNCVLYLLCVISAIVAISSLVKSGESTFILVTLPSKTRYTGVRSGITDATLDLKVYRIVTAPLY